ncbi:uncharacterized protein LOC125855900 [Solanum stenotomum]|uniref:uncharacterized protein LOC125855900 n=1 Tax=Solanum stenotomum TaxID=172797 RepID=UPI0020D1C54D|nr:uncharacterized protein LOC125855900 [Solanum stenotomum]
MVTKRSNRTLQLKYAFHKHPAIGLGFKLTMQQMTDLRYLLPPTTTTPTPTPTRKSTPAPTLLISIPLQAPAIANVIVPYYCYLLPPTAPATATSYNSYYCYYYYYCYCPLLPPTTHATATVPYYCYLLQLLLLLLAPATATAPYYLLQHLLMLRLLPPTTPSTAATTVCLLLFPTSSLISSSKVNSFNFSIPLPDETPSTPVCRVDETGESTTPFTEAVTSPAVPSEEILPCSPTLILSDKKSQNSEAQSVAKVVEGPSTEEVDVASRGVSSAMSERFF